MFKHFLYYINEHKETNMRRQYSEYLVMWDFRIVTL